MTVLNSEFCEIFLVVYVYAGVLLNCIESDLLHMIYCATDFNATIQ